MSATRTATEMNVRYLIDDLDPDDYAISSVRMHQYLQGQMQVMSTRLILPMEAVTSVAVTGGTYDYTLTGIVGDVRKVLWSETGRELARMTFDDICSAYLQDTDEAVSGEPCAYALYETSAQASKLRLGPTPDASGTLKLYYGIIPAALTTDASVIPFSAPLLRALERLTAAECVAVMSGQDKQRRMVGPESVRLWREMAEQAIVNENYRMRSMGALQSRIVEVEG